MDFPISKKIGTYLFFLNVTLLHRTLVTNQNILLSSVNRLDSPNNGFMGPVRHA